MYRDKRMIEIDEICNSNNKFDFVYYVYKRLLENGVEKSDMPIKLGLNITNKCKFKCLDCFVNKGSSDMSYDLFTKIFNEFEYIPVEVYLTGGDPFLNEYIFDFIDYLFEKGIKVKIHSTGILSDENLNKLVDKLHKIEKIQISIDSIQNFNNIRFNNIEEPLFKISEFIKNINDKDKLIVNTVVSKRNYNDIFDIIDYMNENDVRYLNMSPIMTENKELLIYDDELLEYYHTIVKYSEKMDIEILSEPYCHPFSIKLIKDYKFIENDRFYCPAGKTEVEIDFNGNVYPCPFMNKEEYMLGNIYQGSLKDIWSRESPCKAMKWTKNSTCKKCDGYDYCGGGCIAFAIMNKDDHDSRCLIQRRKK